MLTCIGCDDAAHDICNEYEKEGDEEGRVDYRCVHCGHAEECHVEETDLFSTEKE
jgi:hypothetical protein